MDPSYDHNLLARILLTLMTAGYGLLTVKADFNRTHATNPLWTPHARFHVVWQISSYVGFALIAFALIWTPGALYVERLYLVCAFGADPAALARAELTGTDPVLPSSFPVGTAAQASIAAAALAAAERWRLRSGKSQRIGIDMRHAAIECRSERYLRAAGKPQPDL